jgi:molybdenum cofactor cytidylyltransferase
MKAILLAAGFSTRMGEFKQVMKVAGMPMVRQVAGSLLSAGLEVLVIVGYRHAQVQEALSGLSCEYILNPRPEQGMFSSVQLGCARVETGTACLVTPCDCPGVLPATIRQVQQTVQHHRTKVIIPTFQGRRGHPVGLPASLVDMIRTLSPTTPGLNSLWRETPELVMHVEVDDPAVLRDFDRPEDIET